MTLAECSAHIGDWVIYTPRPLRDSAREVGVITAIGSRFAFVAFTGPTGAKACSPEDLTLPPAQAKS